MSLKITKPNQSQIDLGPIHSDNQSSKEDKLQRTDQWLKDRQGCWTGSKIKNIMACNSKGGKMSWSDQDKIYEFSKGVIKYVYSRAMERKTKRYIESSTGPAMEYGTKVEPYIIKIGEHLIGQPIEDVGFKSHPIIDSLGASSDGISQDRKLAIEIKACTTWETHYDRTFDSVNEKSTDFWQTQLEMMVWNVDQCAYLIAEPPNSIFDYLNELKTFDEFEKECGVSVEYIKASKFHQEALLKRVQIVEEVCENWIEEGSDLASLFWETVDYYRRYDENERAYKESHEGLQKFPKPRFPNEKTQMKNLNNSITDLSYISNVITSNEIIDRYKKLVDQKKLVGESPIKQDIKYIDDIEPTPENDKEKISELVKEHLNHVRNIKNPLRNFDDLPF